MAILIGKSPQRSFREASLSRLVSQFKQPFVIITAFRQAKEGERASDVLKQNREHNKKLISDLRALKLGGTKLLGYFLELTHEAEKSGWKYSDDYSEIGNERTGETLSPEQAKERGIVKPVEEESFFVTTPGLSLDQVIQTFRPLVQKYNQNSALISDGKKMGFLQQKGDPELTKTPSIETIAAGYSRLRKRPKNLFSFV